MIFKDLLEQYNNLFEDMLLTTNNVKADFATVREIDVTIDRVNQKMMTTTNPYDIKDMESDITTLKKWRKELTKETR